jgi:hypothetical protein
LSTPKLGVRETNDPENGGFQIGPPGTPERLFEAVFDVLFNRPKGAQRVVDPPCPDKARTSLPAAANPAPKALSGGLSAVRPRPLAARPDRWRS